jgi:catechol 2,3-dioxygenase-like lactoylglutathione lyase family enzyme
MDMKLELVPVPVTDVDRAKAFYEQAGSVKGLHLVVGDIDEARAELGGRGVEVGEVDDMQGVKYVPFSDPDGNLWLLQQFPATD